MAQPAVPPIRTRSVIRIATKEDEIFEVDEKIARMSMTFRTMLDDLSSKENELIKVPRVSSHMLRIVLRWATRHVNDAAAVDQVADNTDSDSDDDAGPRRTNNMDPWDVELLRPLDPASLFELIMACNYLNVKGLLTVCGKTIANLVKGKTPQQIRQVFNVDKPVEPRRPEGMEQ